MTVGEKIYKLRKRYGLSQKALAEKIGAKPSSIGVWEAGRCDPTMKYLIALADYFEISLDDLCCRDFRRPW